MGASKIIEKKPENQKTNSCESNFLKLNNTNKIMEQKNKLEDSESKNINKESR